MHAKGRCNPPSGESHHLAKLDEAKVRKIRHLHRKLSRRLLAEMFRVSASTIQAIQEGRTWKKVK